MKKKTKAVAPYSNCQVARHVGVTEGAIRKARKAGIFAACLDHRGRFKDLRTAKKEYDVAKRMRLEVEAAGGDTSAVVRYQAARADREEALAAIAQAEAKAIEDADKVETIPVTVLDGTMHRYFTYLWLWCIKRIPQRIGRVFPNATRVERAATMELMDKLLREILETVKMGDFVDEKTAPSMGAGLPPRMADVPKVPVGPPSEEEQRRSAERIAAYRAAQKETP